MLPSLHVRTSVVSSSTAKIYRQGLQRSWCRSGPSPTRGSSPSSSSPPPGSLPTWPQAQIWLCCSCSSLSLSVSLFLNAKEIKEKLAMRTTNGDAIWGPYVPLPYIRLST